MPVIVVPLRIALLSGSRTPDVKQDLPFRVFSNDPFRVTLFADLLPVLTDVTKARAPFDADQMLNDGPETGHRVRAGGGIGPGERVMQPFYGCNLSELLFESLDTRMKTLMADKVETAILYHEARVVLERVALDDSRELEGVVLINVIYRVKSTNSRFNFVFPYYKQEGTDINLTTSVNLLPPDGA